MQYKLNTIEEALEDIKAGKVVIVVDDEDRENEGDFIAAAEKVTPEMINFMATYGRGLICAPLTEERCDELDLNMMVTNNTVLHHTQFTVSIDLIGHGCTTGISVHDRAKTIQSLTNKETKASDLGRPGHIFPLKSMTGGVLRRTGHTEAAVDLARLAGLQPAGILVEILNEDGSMARLPQLIKVAEKHDLKLISIEDLVKYRLQKETLVERQVQIKLPTEFGDFDMVAYEDKNSGEEHLALIKGEWNQEDAVLVRVHSSCMTGDIFGSCRCDCGPQLHEAMRMIQEEGRGVIVYMNQEGRGIGMMNKLRAYKLQEEGYDTIQANEKLGFKGDQRDYGIGAQILRDLNVRKMRLMSNNPTKRTGLIGYGLEVVENVSLEIDSNKHNKFYLETKRDRMGHDIEVKNND